MLVIKEMQGCAKDDFPDFISLIKTKRTARFLKAAAFFIYSYLFISSIKI